MTTKIDLQKPLIVCLCGSGRFKEAFDEAEFSETLKGRIVLTIGCNTKDIARDADWEHVKPMLDELHRRKIDLADEILVLNVGGYIGDSTRGEILYAEGLGKRIRYLEPLEVIPENHDCYGKIVEGFLTEAAGTEKVIFAVVCTDPGGLNPHPLFTGIVGGKRSADETKEKLRDALMPREEM